MLASIVVAALFAVSPCVYAGERARCGSMAVPENRAARNGRSIDIAFVVIPSQRPSPKEPVFEIAGGPGQAAIALYSAFFQQDTLMQALHRERDVVVVDQRGTGESHALQCDVFATDAATYGSLFPLDPLRRCRQKLSSFADLDAYGTAFASDDLNQLRLRLGYRKIVLHGGSYGTTLALVYMRRHKASVKAALLEGVAPPWLLLPLPFAQGAQQAFDDLVRSCAEDAVCSARFPKFREEFYALVQLSKRGIPVKGAAIRFEVFADRMRQAMYDEYTASYLPLIVHDAAMGDVEPLRKLVAQLSRSIPGSLAIGMNLSVTCSESLPFTSISQARAMSAHTFMGDSRYQAQRAACTMWHVRPVQRSFLDPIRSSVPVLMINGAQDPATPPQYGARELRYLPNGRQILIPHEGHDISSACMARIEHEFLQTYSVRQLDTRCARGAHRPPFATDLSGLAL